MSSWEMKIITSEARRLIEMSACDAGIRAELRTLAGEILQATTEAPMPVIGGAENPEEPVETSRKEPLRELTLGQATAPSRMPVSRFEDVDRGATGRDELTRIRERCRAKCDAIRWQEECHRRLWEGVESPIEDTPADPELVEWSGRLVDHFYRLVREGAFSSHDLSRLDELGGCYEAMAEGLGLLAGVESSRGKMERALPLLAEAQSMLRQALQRLGAAADSDQLDVYRWVRDAAAKHRIYVRRYLRADDPADPSRWDALLSRIEAAASSGQPSRQVLERVESLRKALEPIRHGEPGDADWQAVVDQVEAAVGEGIPPSNRELRDLLIPVIDDLPDREDLPQGFRLVLRELDRYLATRTPRQKPTSGQAIPPEVKEAARLLDGRSVVLIGGIRRPEAQESLRKALRLKDLIWIETREHQSIEPFEPVVARSDVALVLLAIRWSSHAFGDVRQFCVEHGKPMVRLPGGYGAHQVAVQILAQASELLKSG